ncbi:hypothetical protein T4B_14634 [Trichinella pseudospiralis]|uniref:Uncharacterized protein n=1 Tax=Trichinella pseudospiralis TaxID=6337 RepID=A0A0V1JRJ2_TRIPS|nr:hypothetical protein T4B_14634 [Trichinella pseudospiralis]KRZ37600.1 hypothetical protein T4C_1492 [Trichinella pseudospiralis]
MYLAIPDLFSSVTTKVHTEYQFEDFGCASTSKQVLLKIEITAVKCQHKSKIDVFFWGKGGALFSSLFLKTLAFATAKAENKRDSVSTGKFEKLPDQSE